MSNEPKDDVPEWAIDRVLKLHDACWTVEDVRQGIGPTTPYNSIIKAFARYIASHEEEPVDPDETLAKTMAKHAEPDMVTPLPSARLSALESHILAAIKRGRELERDAHHGAV